MPYVATYFDGYSSVPHTTELKLDANQGLLLFDIPYKSEVSWKVEDISYEKYGNLIVRVGGYSERFIDLPNDVQLEVMKRTLY